MSVYGSKAYTYSVDFFDNLEISPKTINEISDYFLKNQDVTFIQEAASANLSCLDSFLSKVGLKGNTNKIKSEISKTSTSIVDEVKKNGINKESRESIAKKIDNLTNNIKESLESFEIDELKYDKYDANKITRSILLLMMVIIVNTVLATILIALFGPLGQALLAIVVAPITEEMAKRVSIRGKFTVEFAVIFNLYEAVSYSNMMSKAGIKFAKAFKLRLIVASMHITTTIIQFLSQNEEVRKFLKLDEKKVPKETTSLIGQIIGMIIHGIWNTLASFSSKFTNILMKAAGI